MGPKVFVRRFLAGSGETASMKERARARKRLGAILPAWQPRQWAYAAGAAAAMVLVCLGSWALWHPRELPVVQAVTKPTQPDPFVASLVQRDLRLAVAQTARERLEVLTDLSDDLFHQTRLVVRGARTEDLRQLAQLYEKVVLDGIVRLSRTPSLRAADRRLVLGPIAEHLAQTGRKADHLAVDAPGNAAGALRAIAAAARDAEGRLREVVGKLPECLFQAWPGASGATLILLIEPEGVSSPTDHAHVWQQLTRNRSLIEALVTSGLSLAAEEDPLRRADQCNGLARQLVDEIQQAADWEEDGRAAELGWHLHDLLKGGVVCNLTTVRDHTPPDSTRHKELRRVSEEAQRLTEPLEKRYQTISKAEPGELGRILQSIHDTRAEVDLILKSPVKN
jgi:hypothetical protein